MSIALGDHVIASPGSSPLGIPTHPNSGPGELSVKQEGQLCRSHFQWEVLAARVTWLFEFYHPPPDSLLLVRCAKG